MINAPTIKKAATSKTKRQRRSLKQSNNNVIKRRPNKCSDNLQLKNKECGKSKKIVTKTRKRVSVDMKLISGLL